MRLGSRQGPEPAATAPPAVGGVRWTILTYGVGKLITLGATVVLARLLAPADFGVVMLAFVAMNVIGLFGDLGIGATLVVRQDLDRRALGTALSLLLAAGALLGVLLAALAPAMGAVLDEPRLPGVLVALAPMTVLGGFTWFYQWLLQRDLAFRDRFLGFVAQATAYASVSIVAAALGAGVWSIVAGHLAGQAAMAVVFAWRATTIRPRFDVAVARSLLRSSRGFFLQNTTMLAQNNLDYIAVGHTVGAAPLGLYSMAYRLSELPYLAVADPVARVTFPTFARLRADGQDVTGHYLATLRAVALVTCLWGALLSAAAEPFTRLVYGRRWLPMIGVLSVLAVWGAAKSVQATAESFLNSVGGANAAGVIAACVLIVEAPLLFLAARAGGIQAVGAVVLGGVLLSLGALVAGLARRAGVGARAHAAALAPAFLAGGLAWVAARVVATAVDRPAAVSLVVSLAAGAVVYVAVIVVSSPTSLALLWALVRQAARGDEGVALVPDPTAPADGAPVAPGRTVAAGEGQPAANQRSS